MGKQPTQKLPENYESVLIDPTKKTQRTPVEPSATSPRRGTPLSVAEHSPIPKKSNKWKKNALSQASNPQSTSKSKSPLKHAQKSRSKSKSPLKHAQKSRSKSKSPPKRVRRSQSRSKSPPKHVQSSQSKSKSPRRLGEARIVNANVTRGYLLPLSESPTKRLVNANSLKLRQQTETKANLFSTTVWLKGDQVYFS